MTDKDLIAKRLALIDTCVRELQTLARPSDIQRDVKEARFVQYTLQLAIQAALDVASHVVSDQRMGEPKTNRELFLLLSRNGWLSEELSTVLQRMAGFRNILVHGYEEVDLSIVRDIVENHLDDLLHFVKAVRARIASA